MAEMSDDDLAGIRDEISESTFDDDTVADVWDRLEREGGANVPTVILRLLERQRAELLSGPLSLSVPGQISINQASNVSAIDAAMVRVRQGITLSTTTLVRPNRSRWSSRTSRGGDPSDLLM